MEIGRLECSGVDPHFAKVPMGEAWVFLLRIVGSGSRGSQDSLVDVLSLACQSSIYSFNPKWLFGVLWVGGM